MVERRSVTLADGVQCLAFVRFAELLTILRLAVAKDGIREAMRQGGTVAIWEIEAPRRGSPVTSGDGAALYFRLTSTAGTYHGTEYAGWLTAAGFQRVRVTRPITTPGSVLITGQR